MTTFAFIMLCIAFLYLEPEWQVRLFMLVLMLGITGVVLDGFGIINLED